MYLNLFIDVVRDGDGEYTHSEVEGLDSGDSEDLARLLAYAAHKNERLKPVIFKAIALILHKDGHLEDQDLAYSLEAIEEGDYSSSLDCLDFMGNN